MNVHHETKSQRTGMGLILICLGLIAVAMSFLAPSGSVNLVPGTPAPNPYTITK